MYENQEYNIIIGGVRRNITSFETMLSLEPGDINQGIEPLTQLQYLSMLFMNLGYDKCPSDLSFISHNIPIENTKRSQVFDYRPCSRILTINPNGTTLYEMIEMVRYWCKGSIEQGSIIDESKSFVLPNENEIAYNLANGIDIKRKCFISKERLQWNTSDIWTRRLHNINPNINSYYYSHCIRKFREYTKQILVKYPCAVFAASIIDPDILMSIIRNCEMKAAEIADSKYYNGYSAVRRDYDTVMEFIPLFNSQIDHLKNIYMTSGAFGFVPSNQGNVNPVEVVKKLETAMSLPENQDAMSTEDKIKCINESNLTGDDIADIYNYVLKKSMPEFITHTTKTNREQAQYDQMYYPFMKHLHYLLTKLLQVAPNLMSNKDKFILSRPFFLGPNAFGIYLRSENLYVLLTPDLRIIPCVPRQAVYLYKQMYNKDIRLDPDELGDSIEAPECKDIDLSKLDKSTITPDNIVIPNVSMNNIEYEPAILNKPEPVKVEIESVPEDGYSLDASKLVES